MAKFVLSGAYVSVAGVDLSSSVESVELNGEVQLQEATAMGDAAIARLAGLKDWSLQLNFRQDFAAGSVDATLWANLGTQVAVVVRPTTAAVGPTNPEFTGNGLISSYNPLGNRVGETAGAPCTIMGSDGSMLARATA